VSTSIENVENGFCLTERKSLSTMRAYSSLLGGGLDASVPEGYGAGIPVIGVGEDGARLWLAGFAIAHWVGATFELETEVGPMSAAVSFPLVVPSENRLASRFEPHPPAQSVDTILNTTTNDFLLLLFINVFPRRYLPALQFSSYPVERNRHHRTNPELVLSFRLSK
jgi:hypothetical protein